jgi:hypothetical protein
MRSPFAVLIYFIGLLLISRIMIEIVVLLLIHHVLRVRRVSDALSIGVCAVVGAVVHVRVPHLRVVLHYSGISERYVGFAHVQLLVEQHAELADLLNVAVLARVKREALAPNGCVAFGESDDVARGQELTGLVPDGNVDAGGLVRHFESPHFSVLLGYRGEAHVENYEYDVEIFQAGSEVFYQNVLHCHCSMEAHKTNRERRDYDITSKSVVVV